ncbi:MAG: HXXEE domain-containing protein [Anaerolineaceae bacterium]|nr:HXXEE domain-containing protein [Anaerolineaceae bacterium]
MQNKNIYPLLILAPISFLLHNFEESLTMVNFVQQNLQRLPVAIRWIEEQLQLTQTSFLIPVVILTLLLAGLSLRLLFPNPPRWGQFVWSVAMLTLCANAFIHIAQAVWFGGYTPGVLTAVLLQLPITLLSARASIRAGWLTKRAAWGWFFAGFAMVALISIAALFFGKWVSLLF